jgi:hypothetical protein
MIKGSNVAPYLPRGQLDVIGSNVSPLIAGLVVDQIGSGKVAVFKKNAVDKVTIDENGDVRVYGNLTVNGTQTIINTDVGTTERLVITNDGTGPALEVNQTGNASVVDFKDDGVTALTIVNGGNVGIGTATPLAKLHVQGNALVSGNLTVTGSINNIGSVFNSTFAAYSNSVTINTWYIASTLTISAGVYMVFGQLYTSSMNTSLGIAIQSNNSFADGQPWTNLGNSQSLCFCIPHILSSSSTLYLFGNNSTATAYFGSPYSKFYAVRIG